jgi:DNA replication protein DnaC
MSLGKRALVNRDQGDGLTRIDLVRDQPMVALDPAATTLRQADAPLLQATCASCGGAGWVKEAVPFGHPNFGVLFPCQCKQAEWARRTAEELARLSNLDAVRHKTFATFNPSVPGLRELIPQIRGYAGQPDGWLTLLGPYGVGKTHLAAAIANEALDRGEGVL